MKISHENHAARCKSKSPSASSRSRKPLIDRARYLCRFKHSKRNPKRERGERRGAVQSCSSICFRSHSRFAQSIPRRRDSHVSRVIKMRKTGSKSGRRAGTRCEGIPTRDRGSPAFVSETWRAFNSELDANWQAAGNHTAIKRGGVLRFHVSGESLT